MKRLVSATFALLALSVPLHAQDVDQAQAGDIQIDPRDVRICARAGCVADGSVVAGKGDAVNPAAFLLSGQSALALRTGAMDASPAFSAAMAASGVQIPCGTYRWDRAPTVPSTQTSLTGNALGCVTININFPTGDALYTTAVGRFEVGNLLFFGMVPRTSGAIVHLGPNTYGATLRNLAFDGQRLDDVVVDGANTSRLLDSDFRPGALGDCVRVTGTSLQAVDTTIGRTNLSGCNVGLHINSASGVYLDTMDIVGSKANGVLVNPTSAQDVNAIRAVDVLVDSTLNGHGFQIGGVGAVTEVHLDHLWASGSGSKGTGVGPANYTNQYTGLYANNPNLNGLQITAFYGHGNGGQAIDIEAGQHIKLTSPMACNNGQYATNAFDGIVLGNGVDWATIMDPSSGQCGNYQVLVGQSPSPTRYGLFINNNAQQHITLMGGQFDGNTTGTWFANVQEPNFVGIGANTPAMAQITVPAASGTSTLFNYVAVGRGTIYLQGGAITGLSLVHQGTTIPMQTTEQAITVAQGDAVSVAYTSNPYMYFVGN